MTRQALCRAWPELQVERPLVLAPVSAEPPLPLGADLTAGGAAAITRSMRMVVAVNRLGLPAAAVPAGVGRGLPQGGGDPGRLRRADPDLTGRTAPPAPLTGTRRAR